MNQENTMSVFMGLESSLPCGNQWFSALAAAHQKNHRPHLRPSALAPLEKAPR